MNSTIHLLNQHRTVRRFKSYPLKQDTLEELVLAGQRAATSNFAQAYTLIQVEDPEKRKILAELSGNQRHVEEAPLFLVFVADLERIWKASALQNTIPDTSYTEALILATVDTSLMAQNIMIAAESLGLGGVYVGGIRNQPQVVTSLLHLPAHTYPLFGMCLGFPDEWNDQKPRLPLPLVLKKEVYDRENELPLLQAYDAEIAVYYEKSRQTSGMTWTRQMARMFSKPLRPQMKAFLSEQELDLK